jgi:hypothetical protein
MATISGQRDVSITTLQDGQVLQWNATEQKWVNGTVTGSAGEWQPVSTVLTAISLLSPSEGVLHQQEDGLFTLVPLDDFAEAAHTHGNTYAPLNHNHDEAYSAITHNHDARYAMAVHYHDELYSPISHNHDAFYISVVTSPTVGNFPVLTAGGELNNSTYGPSSFATAVHNHDTVYAAKAITITGTSSISGGGDLSTSRQLALVGDVESPGANKVYGTDATGARGWKADPAGGGGTVIEGTGLLPVANLAALRAITAPADNDVVYVKGHTTEGDTGGGVFWFDAAVAQTRMVNTATIATGGTGYSANTLLRVSGGTAVGSRNARALITAVTDGAVTSIILIDKGNYTVDPTTPAATTCIAGTGCTLNLTFAKFDDSGTKIAPTTPSVGMWLRQVETKEMNVRWFGAKGLFAGDERQMVQNAINAASSSGTILINQGRYICANTLYLENEQTLRGAGLGSGQSVIWASNTAVPALKVNDSPASGAKSRVSVRDLCFGANGAPYSIYLAAVTEALIENVQFTSAVTLDNIYMTNCWGSRISLCRFYGATGRAHIHLGRPSSHSGNHGITIDRIYTSSGAQYGILCDSDTGAECGIGIHINDCVIQGHDTAQVAILSGNTISINGLYTEDGPRPIILGDSVNNRNVGNVHISGSSFMTYGTSPVLLDQCGNVTFFGCNLNVNSAHTEWLHYNKVSNVHITGCAPNDFHAGVRRTSTATEGINIIKGSSASEAASITMLASGGSAHQHYKMSINGSGSWVATSWTPTALP